MWLSLARCRLTSGLDSVKSFTCVLTHVACPINLIPIGHPPIVRNLSMCSRGPYASLFVPNGLGLFKWI